MAHDSGNNKEIIYVGDSRVRANGPKPAPKDYSEFPGKTEPFFPNFLLKEWMVAVVFLVGFMTLVMAEEPPLGDLADPNNTSFIPIPEWYFLFLYQLLKFEWASGPFVVIGILVIPGLAITALLLAPWLDRGKERRPLKRPVATGLMVLTLLSMVFLTWEAVVEYNKTVAARGGGGGEGGGGDVEIVAADDPAYTEIYKNQACAQCHGQNLEGTAAPSLLGVGKKLSAEEILEIINKGRGAMPPGTFQGTEEEKKQLAEWLAKQK